MKKLILLILIPALILTLGGCFVASTRLQVEEAAKIDLSSGEGAAVKISDSGDIRYITENINTLRFEKVSTDREYSRWDYSLAFYGPDGGLMDEMLIISGNRVQYGGIYYDSIGATIDTVFLDRMLEGG